MQLALFCGVTANAVKAGPTVRLHPGRWKIITEGVKDSVIEILLASGVQQPMHHEIEGDQCVQAVIAHPGREHSLNIYAELLNAECTTT